MSMIPKQHGYESVSAVKTAYTEAKMALDEVRRKQAEWDGVTYPEVQKPQHQSQKVSVLKQLAAKQVEVSNQEHRSGRSKGVEL